MSAKHIFASLLAASLTAGALVSCGGGGTSSSGAGASTGTPASSSTSGAASSSGAAQPDAAGITYPVSGAPKITYWVGLNSNVAAGSASMNETAVAKALIEETGVQVEYIHPAQGQDKEAFNLMIASGDLPDIIEYGWLSGYPGGPELAFKNKILEPLNENMEKLAPDYAAYLKANPDIDKMVRTDEGNYFGFPFIRGDENLMVFYGPFFRADWLKELSLEVPTTIEEWHGVLTAFKDKKGSPAPLTTLDKDLGLFGSGFLCGAFGITTGFNLDDSGNIVYGPVQPGFKDFLTEMNKWYKEGLIDQNFYTNDRAAAEALLLNDEAGATVGFAGSGLGVFEKSLKELNPEAGYVGAPYPVLNKGETPKFGQRDFAFMNSYAVAGVTAASKNKEAAYAFLNYGYTEAGNMTYNFGTEGESYTMEGDYPTYTAMVTDPGEGKTMAQMMGQYMRSNYGGPFVQRLEYYEQYMQMDVQKESVNQWKNTEAVKYQVPSITPTQDESKEYNTIKTNMDAWLAEWAIGAITGKNSLDEFDSKFVAEMKSIGIDRALEIQKNALERYKDR